MDIASMMQKLEKSEKTREEIEQKLMVQDAKLGTALIDLVCVLAAMQAPLWQKSLWTMTWLNLLHATLLCYIKTPVPFSSARFFLLKQMCTGTSVLPFPYKNDQIKANDWKTTMF